MRRLLHAMISFAAVLASVMNLACSARPLDPPEEDFTEVVEQICASYCQTKLACHEPPPFETYEDCEEICLGFSYIYNDTDCGEAMRNMMECIGSQLSCELYNDTNNVHDDDYTCKAEKDHWVGLNCGQSAEDPFPQETP